MTDSAATNAPRAEAKKLEEKKVKKVEGVQPMAEDVETTSEDVKTTEGEEQSAKPNEAAGDGKEEEFESAYSPKPLYGDLYDQDADYEEEEMDDCQAEDYQVEDRIAHYNDHYSGTEANYERLQDQMLADHLMISSSCYYGPSHNDHNDDNPSS